MVPTIEPQVGLSIELVLQMVSKRLIGGVMSGATEGAVADSPNGLPFDDDGEPPAFFVADLALAGDEHTYLLLENQRRRQVTCGCESWAVRPNACITVAWSDTPRVLFAR